MVGVGSAASLMGSGEGRFTQVSVAYRRLVSEAQIDTCPSYPLAAPMALGGFAFDPSAPANPVWEAYPDALLIVPRFLFLSAEPAAWCTINLQVSASCDPDTVTDDIVGELA